MTSSMGFCVLRLYRRSEEEVSQCVVCERFPVLVWLSRLSCCRWRIRKVMEDRQPEASPKTKLVVGQNPSG